MLTGTVVVVVSKCVLSGTHSWVQTCCSGSCRYVILGTCDLFISGQTVLGLCFSTSISAIFVDYWCSQQFGVLIEVMETAHQKG